MSIVETNKIDAMGISKDKKSLVLMLSDHIDWNNEAEHLNILQEKINSYLGFIESKQYEEIYPENEFISFVIDIRFKYKETENCLKFIEIVKKQLGEAHITVNTINIDNGV